MRVTLFFIVVVERYEWFFLVIIIIRKKKKQNYRTIERGMTSVVSFMIIKHLMKPLLKCQSKLSDYLQFSNNKLIFNNFKAKIYYF